MKNLFRKIFNYEYWSFWVFYFIFIPTYIWFGIKAKSLLYFTAVNPSMHYGGLFNYSKYKVLKQLDQKLIPETIYVKKSSTKLPPPMDFPFIVKPDMGERGRDVELLHSLNEWDSYSTYIQEDFLVQEYIDQAFEFGVFYTKYPQDSKGKITGITGKKFLKFIGDGKKELREFIENNPRASDHRTRFYLRYHDILETVLPKGEEMIIEEIGNHNRGTEFYDASNLNNPSLENKVDQILEQIPEFYYGRIDVKAKSIEEFKRGEFTILEVNGANSEATHVFDTNYTLLKAWKEVYRHLKIQHEISIANHKRGVAYAPFVPFVKDLWKHIIR